jgi:hypothetical protein
LDGDAGRALEADASRGSALRILPLLFQIGESVKLLSDDEALEWSRSAGPGTIATGVFPFAEADDARERGFRIRIRIPNEPTAIAGLAYMLVLTGVPDHDEARFAGAMLWLREWEIWSESIDRTGHALLDGIRRLSGRSDSLRAAPAQAFGPGEFFWACASLSLPMMFQWDAWFVAADGSHAVSVSHEGYLDFIACTEQVRAELLARFHRWTPEPVAG